MPCNTSMPSCPLLASRLKFMSSSITSGASVAIKWAMRSGVVLTFTFSKCGFSSRFSAKSTSSLSSTMSIVPYFILYIF